MPMSKIASDAPVLGSIANLINNLQREKRASANTEEGQANGSTSHPSGKTEDGTTSAQTGAKETENTEEAKKENPHGPDAVGKIQVSQDRVQTSFGTTQALTGEDPGTDRDYQMGHPDPGTSHPAKTEPVKKSFDQMSYTDQIKLASDLATKLTNTTAEAIKIANDHGGILPENEEQSRYIKMSMELQQQYEQVLKHQKQAADNLVRESVTTMMLEGAVRADLVVNAIKEAYDADQAAAAQNPTPSQNPPARKKQAEGMDPAMMSAATGAGEEEEPIPGEEEMLAQEMGDEGGGMGGNDPNELTPEDLDRIMAMVEGGEDMPAPSPEEMTGGEGGPGAGGEGGGMESLPPEVLAQLQALSEGGGAPKVASDKGAPTKKKKASANSAKPSMYQMLQELQKRSNI